MLPVGPIDNLARIFGSMRRALKLLSHHYKKLAACLPPGKIALGPDGRAADLHFPYPLRRLSAGVNSLPGELRPRLMALGLVPGSAVCLSRGRLVYLCSRCVAVVPSGPAPGSLTSPGAADGDATTLSREERVVVKFCMRPFASKAGGTGEAVHRLWAAAGLAPQLYAVERLPGGIDMVVVEYLDPAAGWVAAGEDQPEESRQALRAAHALGGHVHGDMRGTNIMVRKRRPAPGLPSDGGYDVRFIDFDWAGEDGVVRCPTFINPEAGWPPGMKVGVPLTQQLDCQTLALDLMGRFFVR